LEGKVVAADFVVFSTVCALVVGERAAIVGRLSLQPMAAAKLTASEIKAKMHRMGASS
jgi:hypothetical protein